MQFDPEILLTEEGYEKGRRKKWIGGNQIGGRKI